jgi:hypothetical protein
MLTVGADMHLVVTGYVNALADAGRAPASIERPILRRSQEEESHPWVHGW